MVSWCHCVNARSHLPHEAVASGSAKSNKICMGIHPMPSGLRKVINFAWAHTQCLRFCQKQYNLHGHTPNAFNSVKSDKFCKGTHPMLSILPTVINCAWAHTHTSNAFNSTRSNKFCMGTQKKSGQKAEGAEGGRTSTPTSPATRQAAWLRSFSRSRYTAARRHGGVAGPGPCMRPPPAPPPPPPPPRVLKDSGAGSATNKCL